MTSTPGLNYIWPWRLPGRASSISRQKRYDDALEDLRQAEQVGMGGANLSVSACPDPPGPQGAGRRPSVPGVCCASGPGTRGGRRHFCGGYRRGEGMVPRASTGRQEQTPHLPGPDTAGPARNLGGMRAWTAASSGFSSTSPIQPAICRISGSRMPRVVRAGVPMRMPLTDRAAAAWSNGIVFLLTVMPAASERLLRRPCR